MATLRRVSRRIDITTIWYTHQTGSHQCASPSLYGILRGNVGQNPAAIPLISFLSLHASIVFVPQMI
jgi:hypothetical protein